MARCSLLFLAFFLFPGFLAAEIGTVYLDLVIAFHPLMLQYDMESGRFERRKDSVAPGQIYDAFSRDTQEKQTRLEGDIARLENEILQARSKIQNAVLELQNEYNRQMLNADKEERVKLRAKMNEEIARAEQRDGGGVFPALEKKQTLEKELSDLKIRISYGDKMSVYECRLQAKSMYEEILKIAGEVSKENKLDTVLDSSAHYPHIDSFSADIQADPGAENLYRKMIEKRPGRDQLPPEDPGNLEGDAHWVNRNAINWFDNRRFYMKHFLPVRGGSYVLLGGKDITEPVIAKLLATYRYPVERIKTILLTLRTLRRVE